MRLALPLALALAVAATTLPLGATARADGPAAAPQDKVVLETVYVAVKDVKDDAGAAKVEAAATGVAGVRSFAWTAARTEAKVVRVAGTAGNDVLVKAIADGGYVAETLVTREARLVFVKALHCPACVLKVEETSRAIAATKEVEVAEDRKSVRIVYDTKKADEKAYRAALAEAGYPIAE